MTHLFLFIIYLEIFLYHFSVVQTCNTFANKNRTLYGCVITWEEYAIKKHLSANDSFDNYLQCHWVCHILFPIFFSGSKLWTNVSSPVTIFITIVYDWTSERETCYLCTPTSFYVICQYMRYPYGKSILYYQNTIKWNAPANTMC